MLRVVLFARHGTFSALALFGLALCAVGGDRDLPAPGAAPRLAAPAEVFRPTALPDRLVLTWQGDPATSQAVTWRTAEATTVAIAELAPAGDGPRFVAGAKKFAATSRLLPTNLGPARYHTVNFTGLTPRTKYAYRVGDGVNWSEWNQFQTASDRAEPFTFIYFGDAQNDLRSHWSRVAREAFRDAPRAAFTLHAGDLVNRATNDGDWGEWFEAGGFIHRVMPCVATPGNHEYTSSLAAPTSAAGDLAGAVPAAKVLAPHWRACFAFPENGPEGLKQTTYFFDHQGARFVSLNSNERQAEQADWLRRVLAENPQRWTIVTFHHPLHTAKKGRDASKARDLWQPVFDATRVDLALQGHDHHYARSGLMTHEENLPTGAAARSAAGTVYVVSVSGPKMYRLERQPHMRRVAEDTQLYQIISIDGDTLRYEARTAAGRLYDAFSLHKRDGQPNELREAIPDTPETRRDAAP